MENRALSLGNRLEGILRGFLDCGYNEFGVKSNDNLTKTDWRSPINFALGYKYAQSNRDENIKREIEYFLGNILVGISIGDVINKYEYYGYPNVDTAYEEVEHIIDEFESILKK